MGRVERILMKRDGLSEEEAKSLVSETKSELKCAIESGDYDLAEEILAGDLGLEMDYVFDLI